VASEHFVEDDAEGVDIGGDGEALAGELFGGGIGGGGGFEAIDGAGEVEGEAEIGDDGAGGGEDDVAGFEIAVEDAEAVGGVEAEGEIANDGPGGGERDGA
jgi:hypothetical protein